jgi:nucleoside-diphosphate-sugar epimerase
LNHNPRILIAGCGYTGERCADLFFAEGLEVTALVATPESAQRLAAKPYTVTALDAADPGQLSALLDNKGPQDLLVHCLSGRSGRDAAAYRQTYVETLRQLLGVFAPAFSVFTSSTSVYPQNDGRWVDETSEVGGTPTGDVLVEAERLALAAGGAAVRLGGIYGPGRSRFIAAALSGEPLPGDASGCVNFTHADDAAAAIAHVVRGRLAGAFNAVDDHPVRRADLAEAIRSGAASLPAPSEDSLTGKRVRNAKLRATGWAPRYPGILDAIRAGAV